MQGDLQADGNKAIIVSMEDSFNRRDWASFEPLFAPVVSHQRQRSTEVEFVRVFKDIASTFPDCFVEIERLMAEEDWVVELTKITGTHVATAQTDHHGGLLGVAPTGRAFKVRQSHFWRLHEGRIVEHEVVRDDLGLLRQLGLTTPRPIPPS
jgi:steroid delta-isomerase-like uncharacterized protein